MSADYRSATDGQPTLEMAPWHHGTMAPAPPGQPGHAPNLIVRPYFPDRDYRPVNAFPRSEGYWILGLVDRAGTLHAA